MKTLIVVAVCLFALSPVLFLMKAWLKLSWTEFLILIAGVAAVIKHLFKRKCPRSDYV